MMQLDPKLYKETFVGCRGMKLERKEEGNWRKATKEWVIWHNLFHCFIDKAESPNTHYFLSYYFDPFGESNPHKDILGE